MKLIVGLGNPGPKYAGHRHNVGFMVLNALNERLGQSPLKEKFKGLYTKVSLGSEELVLLGPMTYMNLSGESVQKAAAFFKVAPEDILVVHDELDLPFGELRLKKGGGVAGHNGLRSIVQHLGPDFLRLRIGIGRPQGIPVENYVLTDFSKSEKAELGDLMTKSVGIIEDFLRDGVDRAMNLHHARK